MFDSALSTSVIPGIIDLRVSCHGCLSSGLPCSLATNLNTSRPSRSIERSKVVTVSKIYCYEFKALLEGQREHMLECLRSTSPASGKNRDLFAAQMSFEGQQLSEIEAALARIGEGRYGECINCSGEISRARLKGDPTVKHCTGCQVSPPTESSTRE